VNPSILVRVAKTAELHIVFKKIGIFGWKKGTVSQPHKLRDKGMHVSM